MAGGNGFRRRERERERIGTVGEKKEREGHVRLQEKKSNQLMNNELMTNKVISNEIL